MSDETVTLRGRKLAMPDARVMTDLFVRWAPWAYGDEYPMWAAARLTLTGPDIGKALMGQRKRDGSPDLTSSMEVTSFCSARGLSLPGDALGLVVQPRWETLAAVEKNTIVVEDDRMSWEIIRWNEREALVLCSHGKICGSVWLAVIDPATVVL